MAYWNPPSSVQNPPDPNPRLTGAARLTGLNMITAGGFWPEGFWHGDFDRGIVIWACRVDFDRGILTGGLWYELVGGDLTGGLWYELIGGFWPGDCERSPGLYSSVTFILLISDKFLHKWTRVKSKSTKVCRILSRLPYSKSIYNSFDDFLSWIISITFGHRL